MRLVHLLGKRLAFVAYVKETPVWKSGPLSLPPTSIVSAISCAAQIQHLTSNILPQQQIAEVLNAKYRPAMILLLLGKWIPERKKEGQIGEITATALDQALSNLTEVLGGCERLASTPIPYPYSVMIHRTVYLYCFLLPFGLVSSIGEMTPLISVFIAYTFIVFEQVAQEMSEPFGTQPNDLPLTTICGMIQETIFEMRGAEITQTSGLPQTSIVQ